MKHYMLISTLDIEQRQNNREHHVIRHMAQLCDNVTVVYRRDCTPRGVFGAIWDASVPSFKTTVKGNVTYIAVNPVFNHVHGATADLAFPDGSRVDHTVRRRIKLLVAEAGILKDISTVLFLFLAALFHAPGRADICAGFSPWGAAAGIFLRAFGRTQAVFYEDRDYEPGFVNSPVRKHWIALVENWGIRRSNGGICIGRRLSALRAQETDRLLPVVPSGVASLNGLGPINHKCRERLVYIGNVASWAGIELVIDAVAILKERFKKIECLVIGPIAGKYHLELSERSRRLGVEGRISFQGPFSYHETREILVNGGIGLATFRPTPLRRYAAPLKVLDYMSAGMLVIATRGTESEDIVLANDAGLSIDFERDALVAAVTELLSDPDKYETASKGVVMRANNYAWEILLDEEYRILCEVLAKSTGTTPCTS